MSEARRRGRLLDPVLDRGAVFAGWVGVGVAFVVVVAFALVIPLQPLVFVLAPFTGVLLGWYANVRSERRRPRRRVLINAAWAGAVTALGLALFYVAIRLLFIYGDTGTLPDGSRLDCRAGPECVYQRHLEQGRAAELADQGIVDAASFEAVAVREHLAAGVVLAGLALGGALTAGAGQALGGRPEERRLVGANRPE